MAEALIVQAWTDPIRPVGVKKEAAWLRDAMHRVCDAFMPRVRRRPPDGHRMAYWWTSDIADLWKVSNGARRRLGRHRHLQCRGDDHQQVEAVLYERCKQARTALQQAIARAKVQAWDSLVETLNKDPWGRPYKIVRKKLRTWTPPATESLHPRELDDVLDRLFPSVASGDDVVQHEVKWRPLLYPGPSTRGSPKLPRTSWGLPSGVRGPRIQPLALTVCQVAPGPAP